ncbi:hypothetical protein [Nitrosomonas communis]|nr:hypothetical protein [Nitrosomonas communis]
MHSKSSELACCNFAGSNPCRAHSGLGVVLVVEKCVAAGMHTVADGNGTCVAIVVKIIYAFYMHSIALHSETKWVDGNRFHLKFSYYVKEESNGSK